ncbi:hypothetical protein [Jannaschia donghaensis]|uniref:Uncharacterized protein n=1 Tax=Jannaschia donghaensis TaxID=420998 RepID=A0A0M6YG27_9RHOB|nr:hypothetical protein [Jannaschia donghaensis]CTQ48443.1 hypothetical protein JDO7802_00445 [Jannaschia donghaensis]
MPRLIAASLLLIVTSTTLAMGQATNGSRAQISQVEMEWRQATCRASENWLRRACQEVLGTFDVIQPAQAEPETVAPVDRPEVDELHLVGIYEPRTVRQTGQPVRQGSVVVEVDRPGQDVALVLTSHEPVQWDIVASPDTRIARVILSGDGVVRSPAQVNSSPVEVERTTLPLAYEIRGNRFQPFHEAAFTFVGVDRADSFHGAYTAPPGGFLITRAPGLATQAEIEEALLERAVDRADLNASFRSVLSGDGSPAGAKWRFDGEGFIGRDDAGTALRYAAPLILPDISWPMGAAHDPDGGLLWGITLGGEGYLYRFDVASDEWTAWSMENHDAGGLIFDREGGMLIATPGPRRRSAFLVMDQRGQVLRRVGIPLEDFPGLLDTFDPGNGPSPRFTPLAVMGTEILVSAGLGMGGSRASARSPIYLVDLADRSVRLVK